MSKTESATRNETGSVNLLEQMIFVLLVILVAVRPLISEIFIAGELSILRTIQAVISGPTPATTAAFDSACLALAIFVLVRKVRHSLGWHLYYGACALMTLAVVFSTIAADDQRLALNAGLSLLSGILVAGALVILTDTLGRRRILICAVLAGSTATAVQCLLDYSVYNPQTAALWPQQKTQLIEAGYDPNEPLIVNFERRMMANEVSGFQAHPNVTASLLSMWALPLFSLVIFGIFRAKLDRKELPLISIAALVGYLLCSTSLFMTGSLAGMVTGLGGLFLLIILSFCHAWLSSRTDKLAVMLIAGYTLFAGSFAIYGFVSGTLPHPSLEVRWFYWGAAADAYKEVPLTGVGRENFRDAYTQYRPPRSTEEVSIAHNIWVTMLVELGPLGLLSAILLFVLLIFGLARSFAEDEDAPTNTTAPIEVSAICIGIFLFWMLFSDTALQGSTPAERGSTLLVWIIENAAIWLISFAALFSLLRGDRLSAAKPWLGMGILAAIMAVFVHNLVGFSLFIPCGLLTLGGLAACGLSRATLESKPEHQNKLASTIALIGVGTALFIVVARPTSTADATLQQMRHALATARNESEAQKAIDIGWQAVAADPLDPRLPRIIGREILQYVGSQVGQIPGGEWWLNNIKAFSEASLARNPRSTSTLKQYAVVHEYLEMAYLLQAKPDEATAALKTSAETWLQAIERYPTDLRGLVDAGVILTKYWQESEDLTLAAKAREFFQRARTINNGYRVDEPIKLRPHEIQRLQQFEAELPNQSEN